MKTADDMNSYLSDKLRILSFFSIILVLYIHSGFHEIPNEIEGMADNIILQKIISGQIGRCAVPLFFMISGYLFFLKVDHHKNSTWNKIKKRLKSLLIPYIIGNVFFLLFYISIELVPGTAQFINSESFLTYFQLGWTDFLRKVFWDNGTGSPVAFQLWFLQDLILIALLTPLLYEIKRRIPVGGYFPPPYWCSPISFPSDYSQACSGSC